MSGIWDTTGHNANKCVGRFRVDGFWPEEGQTHKIPYEKEEIKAELERLKTRRLAIRAKRLEEEAQAREVAGINGSS